MVMHLIGRIDPECSADALSARPNSHVFNRCGAWRDGEMGETGGRTAELEPDDADDG